MERFFPWDAGVDIFFVISGFVIVHASRSLFAQPGAAGVFIQRRIARIVPLYWLMTSLLLIEMIFDPGAINGAIGGLGFVLKSYLFIPAARPDGVVQPVLGLSWTLNYEMFFYLVFTPFLWLRQAPAVCGASLLLAVFVLAGHAGMLHGVILQTWSNPIILEFCAGMIIALIAGSPRKTRLSNPACIALAGLALIIFAWQPPLPDIAAKGIPAALLLAAAALGKPAQNQTALILGDASYALYLVHPFIMRGFEILAPHNAVLRNPVIYITLCLALAQLTALALHRWLERPLTNHLRARLT
jgi:peptidoglycan/LPS O-acetylase OafA/YrhL